MLARSLRSRLQLASILPLAFTLALASMELAPASAFGDSQDYVPAAQTANIYFFSSDTQYGGTAQCFNTDSAAENYAVGLITSYGGYCSYTNLQWTSSWPLTQGVTDYYRRCPPNLAGGWAWGAQHRESRNFSAQLLWNPGCTAPAPYTTTGGTITSQLYYYCSDYQNYQLTGLSPTPTPDVPACQRTPASLNPLKMPRQSCPNGRCPMTVGNPIDPATGIKFQKETDYVGTGPVPLRLERYYNSFGAAAGLTLGLQWRHTFDRTLLVQSLVVGSQVLLTARVQRPDGQVLAFQNSSGSWQKDGDTPTTLSGSATSGYTYTDADDMVETYDTNGRLLTITTRSGVRQTLTYNNLGQLASVTDSFGRTLTFSYYANGLLNTVTDPAGGVFTYAYDSSQRLTSVAYPDTQTRQYLYNEPAYTGGANLPNALTGVIDENGQRFATYSYDGTGRAISTQHAAGAELVSVTYNTDGSSTITDALGANRTYSYTTTWNVPRVSSIAGQLCTPCGEFSSYSYDRNGNLQSWTTARGVNFNALWSTDGRDLRTGYTEDAGDSGTTRNTTTQWHPTFRLPTQILLSNRQTNFTYDASGNLLTKTVADTNSSLSRTWTYTYNGYGQVLTEKGPRTDVNSITTYAYYSCTNGGQCGQLNTVIDALGHVTTFSAYNAHGQPLTITDPNGVVTTLTYDSRMRMTSRSVGGETTTFSYWPEGQLKMLTLPDGSYVQYVYDNAHRLVNVTDAQGNSIQYTLDAMGNRLAERTYDPANTLHRVLYRTYNVLNELYQQIGAANTSAVTTTFGYDADRNQTTVNAPLSRNTTLAYDKLNRLTKVTDPATGNTWYSYDAYDNLVTVWDPRSRETDYTYSSLGDLTTLKSPDTGTTTDTYDSGGNLASSTDARGAVSSYTYDALNRAISAAYSIGGTTDETISFTYDTGTNGNGHLTGASDANHSMSWSYDGLGRVTSKSQTIGSVTKSAGYVYTNGDLTTLTTPSGQSVSYGYNANHEVTSVTVNATTVLSNVTYEPLGPVNGWTWGNSTTVSRGYDTDGKIASISSGGLKTYSYDNAFRITGITDASTGSANWTYGYDLLDRITNAVSGSVTRGWTYDASGNRLSETGSAASTYTISPYNNQVSAITGALARTYAYDAAGSALSYSTVRATYNGSGRLQTLTQGSATETLVYNALGQRVKTSGGTDGTVLYWYDEAGHLLGEYDGSGNLIEETVWLRDIPVATLRSSGSTVAVYYIHSDHLNTPRQVTRPSDNVQMWTWFSDPFGTTAANSNPLGAGTFNYNLRFPGQVFDGQAALHQNYFRDYDPQVGRYVESDPLGLAAGIDPYLYAAANPIWSFDSYGLASCSYSVAAHTLSCTPNAGGDPLLLGPNGLFSGVGKCRNQNSCSQMNDLGPIPPGDYNMNRDDRQGHEDYWRLEPNPHVPGWKCRLGLSRCGFELHPGGISLGCITADKNNSAVMDQYKLINNLLIREDGSNRLKVVP